MDKYYKILEHFGSLANFLEDQDIDPIDVLAALDTMTLIDADSIISDLQYDEEEDYEA